MKILKTYKQLFETSEELIKETSDLEIKELNYYDIINICNIETLKIDKEYEDQHERKYCDYVGDFIKYPQMFEKKYTYLIGIKNNHLVSLFYKVLNDNQNFYGDGYIISSKKGNANKMFMAMKERGSFTTFSNLDNIGSLKAQLKINAEILCLSDTPPDKDNGTYNQNVSNQMLLDLMKNEKIYFNDTYTNEKFFFMNDNGEIDLSKLSTYLLSNDDIKLIYPKDKFKKDKNGKTTTGLKVYFYHKKQ